MKKTNIVVVILFNFNHIKMPMTKNFWQLIVQDLVNNKHNWGGTMTTNMIFFISPSLYCFPIRAIWSVTYSSSSEEERGEMRKERKKEK